MKALLPKSPIRDYDISAMAEKEKKLVIQVANGGLGDHLTYSSLPELLWKQKGVKTFISNKSVFRSQAIFDFVWKNNPFVEFTNKKGWFTYKPPLDGFPAIDQYLQGLFNLQGKGCPQIYYEPKLIKELKDKTIVDPSCGAAGKANGYFEKKFYKKYIEFIQYNVGKFVLIKHRHSGTRNELQELIIENLRPSFFVVETLEQMADVLYSAKNRYLMYSGAASLAAALNLPSTVLCNKKASPHFQYSINNYIDLIRNKQ